MSLFKGRLDSGNKFTANDDVRGLELIAVSTQPSFHVLETGDNVKWYMWINDSDEWIMHTAAPTASNRNSVGNIITGAGNSGANKTLSNVASVAFPVTIASDTTNTDDLGTSSIYWKDLYLSGVCYLASDATIASGASARLDFVGDIQIGVSGTGNDFTLFADTAGSYIKWSAAGNTNVGTLLIQDDAMFLWGDSSDITMTWVNGGGFEIEAAADDNVIKFGGSTHVDVIWYNKSSTNDMGWIADSSTLQLSGAAVLHFGGSAIDTLTAGWKMTYDDSETLNVDPISANNVFRIGESTIGDFHLDGASGYDVIWDGSDDEFLFNDNAKLVFGGTADDMVIKSDGTDIEITFGATTSSINMRAYAAATTAVLNIDGATNDWDGATGVGMLTLSSDTALAHAAATNLLVTHATTAPITDADGFLARFVSTATARTNAFAIDIVVPVTQPALRVNSIVQINGVTTANAAVLQVTGNDATNDVNAVTINNEGTDYALLVTADDADGSCIKTAGVTSQTAPQVYLDGTTGAGGFIGAAGIGMLALKQDGGTLADATASLIYVDFDGTAAATHKGTCLHIDDNAAGGSGYAAYISAGGATEALWVDDGDVIFDEDLTVTGATTQTGQFVHQPSVIHGSSVIGMARAIWDFSVDGGVVGEETLAKTAAIPDNAILIGGSVHVTTAATSGGAMNIKFGTTAGSADDAILSATAKGSLTGGAMINSDITFAAPVKMSAAGNISVTIETTDATAGVIEIVVLYYVAAA